MPSVVPLFPGIRALANPRTPPEPIRSARAWHGYKLEQKPGKARIDKIPYRLDGRKRVGKSGSDFDLAGMGSFDEAHAAALKYGFDGVAYAFTPGCGVTVVDGDKCLRPDGSLPPELEKLALGTFSEVSVSGSGAHFWYLGNLGDNRFPKEPNLYGLDTFSERGWIAYTGTPLSYYDLVKTVDGVAAVGDGVRALIGTRAAIAGAKTFSTAPDDFTAGWEPRIPDIDLERFKRDLQFIDPSCPREPWFNVLCAGHHQFDGDPAALDILVDWSSGGHNYVEGEVERYWEGMHGDGSGRRRITYAYILKLVKEAQTKPASAAALLAEPAPEPQAYDGKFRPIRAANLSSEPPRWLIRDVLPQSEDPVILYGASTAGKTFVAIDLAMAVARGEPWRGHPVAKGRILIITAEGSRGFRARLQAYCLHYNLDLSSIDIDVLPSQINIMEAEDVRELVRSVRTFGEYVLIIIDTLAQVTPGANENAGEDMSRALANIKAVQIATGSTVMVVHHAGKDVSRGSRGWSGLKAAAEAQLEVSRNEDTGERVIRIDKLKDGQDGVRYGFELMTQPVAMYEDGTEYTSCVVVPAELRPAPAPGAGGRGGSRVKSRSALQNFLLEVIEKHVARSQAGMRKSDLVKLTADLIPAPPAGERDVRRQNVTRSLDRLLRDTSDTAPLSTVGDMVFFHV